MAIDYDSGSGLFDKVGVVVSLTNALETFETSTSSGNLEKEMQDLEAKLDDTKQFDRIARDLMYAKWATYKSTLDQMKVQLTELTRLFMASEICIQDFFDKADGNALAQRLRESMIRDSETVDANAVAVSTAFLDSTASTVQFYGSSRETDTFIESTSRVEGRLLPDSLRFEMSDVTPGRESIALIGSPRGAGPGDPNYTRNGSLLSNYQIRAYDRLNLLGNGAFNLLTPTGSLQRWIFSGVWGTDARMVVSSNYAVLPSVLQWVATKNGRFSQTITGLKPRTKYLVMATVDFADATADGNFTVSVGSASSTVDISTLDTGLNEPVGFMFNTPDQVSELLMYFERTGATAGYFNILGVGIWEMTFLPAYWWFTCFCTPGQDELTFTKPTYPTQLGMQAWNAITPTNDHGGLFQTYFSRFFGINLPGDSGGTESVSDTLAA